VRNSDRGSRARPALVGADGAATAVFRLRASYCQWADVAPPVLKPSPLPAPANLPFLSYPNGGRTLLGKPKWGDGTARRSYGLKALEWCGYRCAYCGLDLSSFEGWLQLSIDHVIPQQSQGAGYPAAWILDATNVVAACMACNGYFNRAPVLDAVPVNLDAFYDVRDRVFLERKARIVARRDTERAWFDEHVRP
jgi:5-methylcytosine-specific restriction endonuclease McrA